MIFEPQDWGQGTHSEGVWGLKGNQKEHHHDYLVGGCPLEKDTQLVSGPSSFPKSPTI